MSIEDYLSHQKEKRERERERNMTRGNNMILTTNVYNKVPIAHRNIKK